MVADKVARKSNRPVQGCFTNSCSTPTIGASSVFRKQRVLFRVERWHRNGSLGRGRSEVWLSMMRLTDLNYPILRINERGVLTVKRPRSLRLMPEVFFKKGGFKGQTFILDAECQRFDVQRIEKIRRSWNLFYLLGGPQKMFVVEYDIGQPVQLSFEEARDLVMERIMRKRWYGQGGERREEFSKRFMSYRSMKEIIDSISGYGQVWY